MRVSRRNFIFGFLSIIIVIIIVRTYYKRKYLSNKEEDYHRLEERINKYLKNISPVLGYLGSPAYLADNEKINETAILKEKGINIALSDRIPLQRKLLDVRDSLCKNLTYDDSLPTASVVIIFHNEALSVLLRTVYSVLQETPLSLLKEIILVDDYSDEDELKDVLNYYIKTRLKSYVKLIRLPNRQGLIKARLKGAQNVTGDVLVFLDAHCEVTKGWLTPLLQRIKENSTIVPMPIIDIISEETLEYQQTYKDSRFPIGGFTWSGDFIWIHMKENKFRSRTSSISPVKSPTMAGGLYAIDRKYFWKIGSYDEKMEGWGGENLEMSFRIWQCGGSLEIVPCSRVGHIFRQFFPYKFPNNKDTALINGARLAYVWMDDYKRLFFFHNKEYKGNVTLIGDISARIKLRENLKCKSFKWYLENVYPEKFIPDENVQACGRVRLRRRNLCLDTLNKDKQGNSYFLSVNKCDENLTPNQYFSISKSGQLRKEDNCAYVVKDSHKVQMSSCNQNSEFKKWRFKIGMIEHIPSGLCLDATNLYVEAEIFATICNKKALGQLWKFEHIGDDIPG